MERSKTSLFRPNPVLNRLSKDIEYAGTETASYRGIAGKVTFFLAMTLVGMIVYGLLSNTVLARGDLFSAKYNGFEFTFTKTAGIAMITALVIGLVSELIAVFSRKLVAVFGSIYTFCQGFFLGFLIFGVLGPAGYAYLGLEALLLTAAVVGVMCWLFATGKIQVSQKFYTVLITLALGSIAISLLAFVGSFIPGVKDVIAAMRNNFGICVAIDVFGIVLATLFLVSDFALIDECVKSGSPRSYEWYAAFGLAFTIIWLYLKILDLLMTFAGKNNSNN